MQNISLVLSILTFIFALTDSKQVLQFQIKLKSTRHYEIKHQILRKYSSSGGNWITIGVGNFIIWVLILLVLAFLLRSYDHRIIIRTRKDLWEKAFFHRFVASQAHFVHGNNYQCCCYSHFSSANFAIVIYDFNQSEQEKIHQSMHQYSGLTISLCSHIYHLSFQCGLALPDS